MEWAIKDIGSWNPLFIKGYSLMLLGCQWNLRCFKQSLVVKLYKVSNNTKRVASHMNFCRVMVN